MILDIAFGLSSQDLDEGHFDTQNIIIVIITLVNVILALGDRNEGLNAVRRS